jgi:hypothetical protein
MFIALAPLLVPVAIWIYTLVFAFASLWFAHFSLTALQRLRAASGVEVLDAEHREDLPPQAAPFQDAQPLTDSTPHLPPPDRSGAP